jgi:hypothetical protein
MKAHTLLKKVQRLQARLNAVVESENARLNDKLNVKYFRHDIDDENFDVIQEITMK